MRVRARRPDGTLLVVFEDEQRGFFFHPEEDVRSPTMNIQSFLARGYWELYEPNNAERLASKGFNKKVQREITEQ